MLRNRVTLQMDKTGFNSSAQRRTAVTGTGPTDERELARAVVRAEAILVASRRLSATFCLCFFLYLSVGVALLAEPRPAPTRPREQNPRPRAVWLARQTCVLDYSERTSCHQRLLT